MNKTIFSIAIFASTVCYGWNLNKGFLSKCVIDFSEWEQQQIEEDLEPFKNLGVDNLMIENTMKAVFNVRKGDVAELVQVFIQDGEIGWDSIFSLSDHAKQRLNSMIKALKTIHEIAPLPNIRFLVSLADRYDRPYFFYYTEAPVFTVSKEKGFTRSILFPKSLWSEDRENLLKDIQQGSLKKPWENRKKIAFWRGSASSDYHFVHWDLTSRPRVVIYSHENPLFIDAGLLENHYTEGFKSSWQHWLRHENCFKPFVSPEEQLQYRYLVAIDGKATPESLTWQLFSGSTVLKTESHLKEWYYAGLKPFIHYLPIDSSIRDLKEKIQWLRDNDEIAKNIAENAKLFAETWLTDESSFAYIYKLLHAYAKIYQN